MSLQQLSLNAALTWEISATNTGFDDTIQGPSSEVFALQGLNLATWNELYAKQYTIAASGTQAVDLRAFTDLAGNVVTTADKALLIFVLVTGAVADKLNVKPHGTNGLIWPFHDASSSIDIPGGGMFAFSEGDTSTGTTIDATHRQLLLTNNGSANLTVKVLVAVSDT